VSAVVIVLTTRAGWLVGPSMRHSRALVHVVRLHGRCRCQPARHAHSTLELKHVHRRGAGGGGGGGLRPPSRPPPSADVPGAPVAPAAAAAPGAGCDRHACHGCTIMSSASNSSIAAWTLGNMARARLATHGLALTNKPITLHNCPPVHLPLHPHSKERGLPRIALQHTPEDFRSLQTARKVAGNDFVWKHE
jgi:hypothetical protein